MKKKFRVTIVKTVEIETHPIYNNPEFQANEVKEFNDSIFKIDDFDDILEYVAGQVARNEDNAFVEGFGRVQPEWNKSVLLKDHTYSSNCAIVTVDEEDFEVEEV